MVLFVRQAEQGGVDGQHGDSQSIDIESFGLVAGIPIRASPDSLEIAVEPFTESLELIEVVFRLAFGKIPHRFIFAIQGPLQTVAFFFIEVVVARHGKQAGFVQTSGPKQIVEEACGCTILGRFAGIGDVARDEKCIRLKTVLLAATGYFANKGSKTVLRS